jgi:Flp pilus assembly protein TadG
MMVLKGGLVLLRPSMPGRQEGQTIVEFAVVVSAFVLMMFAAVSAAFHSVQRAMAETAASAGLQVAASGTAAQPDQPATGAAFGPTRDLLQTLMFGTAIVQGPISRPASQRQGQPCGASDLATMTATVEVCTFRDPANPALVAETVRGRPAYVVPFLAQWLPWSIDITLETHVVSYQG